MRPAIPKPPGLNSCATTINLMIYIENGIHMTTLNSITKTIRKFGIIFPMVASLAGAASHEAIAADQCTSTAGVTSNTIISLGVLGAFTATQTLNGILYTEGEIGLMADRILYTELQIGQMANRIVYVTQFSQTNSTLGIYAVTNLQYLGKENNQYKYSGTLAKVSALPLGW